MVPLNCAGVAGPREVCCLCLAVYSKSSCTDLLRLAVLGAMPCHGVPSCKSARCLMTAFVVDACHTASASAFVRSFGRCPYDCVRVLKDRFCRDPVLLHLDERGFHPIAVLVRQLVSLVWRTL